MVEITLIDKNGLEEDYELIVNGIDKFLTNKTNLKKYKLISLNGVLTIENYEDHFLEDPNLNEKLIYLSRENIQIENSNFEHEIKTRKASPPYLPDQLFIENKPFSLYQMIDLIESGDIDISPDFQRNFVWNTNKQSKLIESIFLGLPLPSMYLSQYQDGRLTIVDGLQRITTIYRFVTNKLILKNLEYLTDCNGKKFSDLRFILEPVRLRAFRQTQIMCFVIDRRCPFQLKYDLFRRLNTGGMPLNDAEIRNCLTLPVVQQALRRLMNSTIIPAELGISTDKDLRMENRDNILRILFFIEDYDLSKDKDVFKSYNGDIDSTLDQFIEELNGMPEEQIQYKLKDIDLSFKTAFEIFGSLVFRKITPFYFTDPNVKTRKPQINKALLVSIMVLITKLKIITPEFHNSEKFMFEFSEEIFYEQEIFEALTTGTNSKRNLETTFLFVKKFLLTHL